jgi:hydroxymethylpyrimidine pyrophosphatase-like HAD family hydrolase
LQPPEYNTELKTSCYLDACPDPEGAAAEIIRRSKAASDRYQVVWSSGRDLDILPAASGKGQAIEFLIELRALSADRVIVAGDSGNDAAMFQRFPRGVVVSNAQPELLQLAEQMDHDSVFLASLPHASGVEQGLEHYGVFAS